MQVTETPSVSTPWGPLNVYVFLAMSESMGLASVSPCIAWDYDVVYSM